MLCPAEKIDVFIAKILFLEKTGRGRDEKTSLENEQKMAGGAADGKCSIGRVRNGFSTGGGAGKEQ